MFLNCLKTKNIALLGMGSSTLSAYKFLYEKGYNLYIWDDNPQVRERYHNSNYNIVNFQCWDFKALDMIIPSPGIPLYYPVPHPIIKYIKTHNVPIITDIELFYYFFPQYQYIGITGSNGKSSLTTLLGNVLNLAGKQAVVAGNIGVPVFSLPSLPDDTYIVLELSSFQLSFVQKMRLTIAILLNIFPNHNDYHGGYENYQLSKFNIFKNQISTDYALLNIEQQSIRDNLYKDICLSSRVIPLSDQPNNCARYFFKNTILGCNEALPVPIYQRKDQLTQCLQQEDNTEINFSVVHDFNTTNHITKQLILFTYTVCTILEIELKILLKALDTFEGLPHRQEIIARTNDIVFVNDSKATTPAAAASALAEFDNIFWLVGGVRKSGTLKICEPWYQKVKHVFIFGKDKYNFAKELNNKLSFTIVDNLKEAVKGAYRQAQSEQSAQLGNHGKKANQPSVILLSPIGTSFDEFSNFEQRGNYFKQIVQELIDN